MILRSSTLAESKKVFPDSVYFSRSHRYHGPEIKKATYWEMRSAGKEGDHRLLVLHDCRPYCAVGSGGARVMDERCRRPSILPMPAASPLATATPRINRARSLRPNSTPTPTHQHQPAIPISPPVALTLFVLAASPPPPFLACVPIPPAHGFHRRLRSLLRQARQGGDCVGILDASSRQSTQTHSLSPVQGKAKKDTVEKVCQIVKKQLAVPDGTRVCGAT